MQKVKTRQEALPLRLRGDWMAYNKIIYDGETLIDLTSDTVTADTLLAGYKAHKADGTIITGTLLDGFPEECSVFCVLTDSEGSGILDSSGFAIDSRTVYKKV